MNPSLTEAVRVLSRDAERHYQLQPGARSRCVGGRALRPLHGESHPVREESRRLQDEGFLEIVPFRGYFIAPLTFDEFRNLNEMLLVLDPAAAAMAAERAPPPEQPEDAPATAGLMRPVNVRTEPRTLVDAELPASVAGGNVETSQRIVDVLLRALSAALPDLITAASSGTMNNLTIGGFDHRTGKPFTYYETIAGGMGARPDADGISGIHTHMTNSLNTPVEALEYAYPLRVHQYRYRKGSGGTGRYRGGDGIVREIELLVPSTVTLLTERRIFAPYGLYGGSNGSTGRSILVTPVESRELPAKCSVSTKAGDRIRIESPGGGGWGTPEKA